MQASQVQHPSLSSPQYPILSRPSPIQEPLGSYSSSPTVRGHVPIHQGSAEAGPSTERGNPVHSSSLPHDAHDFRLPNLQQLSPPPPSSNLASERNTPVAHQRGLESEPSAEPGDPDNASSISDSPSISPPPTMRPSTPLPAASPALTVRPGVPVHQRGTMPGPSRASGYPVHTSSLSHHAQPTPSQQPGTLPSSVTRIIGGNIPAVPQRSAESAPLTWLAPMQPASSSHYPTVSQPAPLQQPLAPPLSTPMSRGNNIPVVYQRSAEPGPSTQPGYLVYPQTSSGYPVLLGQPASQQPLPSLSAAPPMSKGNIYHGFPSRNSAPPMGTTQGYPVLAPLLAHQAHSSRPAPSQQQQQPLGPPLQPSLPSSSAQALPRNDPDARPKSAATASATHGRYPPFSAFIPDVPMTYDPPPSQPLPSQQQQQQPHQQPSSAAPVISRNTSAVSQRNAEAGPSTGPRFVYDNWSEVPIVYDPPPPRPAPPPQQQQQPQQSSSAAPVTWRNIPAPPQRNAEAGPSTAPRHVYDTSPGVPMVYDPPPQAAPSPQQQQQQPQPPSLPPPVSTPLTTKNISGIAEAEPSIHAEDSAYDVSPDGSMVYDPPPSGPGPSQQQPLPPPPPPLPHAAASFAPASGGHAPAIHQRNAENASSFARGHVFAPSPADYYPPFLLRPGPSQQQPLPFPSSSTPVTATQRSSGPGPSTELGYHILPSSTIKLARYSNKYAVDPDGRKVKSKDCVADLAAMERHAQQHRLQAQLQAESAAAEDSLAAKEAQEARALLRAAERGMDYTTLDIHTGVEVARAARERLAAEEQALLRKHALLFFERQMILDGLAETRARVADARSQSAWMDAMQARHVPNTREASSFGLFS